MWILRIGSVIILYHLLGVANTGRGEDARVLYAYGEVGVDYELNVALLS